MISTYLFDLDGTLIDSSIYGGMYEPIMIRLEKKFGCSRALLERKISSMGLVRTSSGRFDSGDVCAAFGCLEWYYEVLEKEVSVNTVLYDSVKVVFSALKEKGMKIGIKAGCERAMHIRGIINFIR